MESHILPFTAQTETSKEVAPPAAPPSKVPTVTLDEIAKELFQAKDIDGLGALNVSHPNSIFIPYYIGLIHHDRGERTKACKSWLQALHIKDDHLPSLRALAMTLTDGDKDDKLQAIECLEKIDDIGKADAADYLKLGDLYFAIEEYGAAHDIYMVASEIDPDNSEPYKRLAILHVKHAGFFLKKISVPAGKKKMTIEDLFATIKE